MLQSNTSWRRSSAPCSSTRRRRIACHHHGARYRRHVTFVTQVVGNLLEYALPPLLRRHDVQGKLRRRVLGPLVRRIGRYLLPNLTAAAGAAGAGTGGGAPDGHRNGGDSDDDESFGDGGGNVADSDGDVIVDGDGEAPTSNGGDPAATRAAATAGATTREAAADGLSRGAPDVIEQVRAVILHTLHYIHCHIITLHALSLLIVT